MKKEIKVRMEELVSLLRDPEVTVTEKEVLVKLEKIVGFMDNPEEIAMEKKEIKEKLETVVALVEKAAVDPDIDIEYCVPEVERTSDSSYLVGDPYILVKYSEDKYVQRKIRLTDKYLRNSAEEVANLVTFSIEQFKEEIDSVQMS